MRRPRVIRPPSPSLFRLLTAPFRRPARLLGLTTRFLGGAAILLAAARLLLLLPRPLSPPLPDLLAFVPRAGALRAAQPLAAAHALRRDLPLPVARGAGSAVHEPDVAPLAAMADDVVGAQRGEAGGERGVRAIADGALAASGLAAFRLIGVVGVHPPQRRRKRPAAPPASRQMAAAGRAASIAVVVTILDAHRREYTLGGRGGPARALINEPIRASKSPAAWTRLLAPALAIHLREAALAFARGALVARPNAGAEGS